MVRKDKYNHLIYLRQPVLLYTDYSQYFVDMYTKTATFIRTIQIKLIDKNDISYIGRMR